MSGLRINWIYPATNLAGGTKSNRLIAEAMARRGHDVHIYYSTSNGPWPSPRHPRLLLRRLKKELGGKRAVRTHHLMESQVPVVKVPNWPIRARDVRDADVVIATWWETREWIESWPASKGLKAYFIRHYEVHGGDPERVKATYRMPGLKLVIARWLARLMEEEFGDPNSVLVPNGVDWKQFDSTPRERGEPPTVGVLYSHTAWKGSETAFAALRLVQKQLPELRVLSFGADPLGDWWPAPANLEFLHRPPQAQIAPLYRRCDCWIVPSVLEGFGMPGLEAAACRCPIVATRCGGPEDYVDHGRSGFLVPVGDAEAMAARVLEVVTQPAEAWREMSEASYQMAKRFDWDRSAEVLEGALLRALGRGGARDGASGPALTVGSVA